MYHDFSMRYPELGGYPATEALWIDFWENWTS